MTPEEWTVGVAVKPPDEDSRSSATAGPDPSSIREMHHGPEFRRGLSNIV